MDSGLPDWLVVKTKADTSMASIELIHRLAGHAIGCAAANAWISSMELKASAATELTVSETDSACNSGFIERRHSFIGLDDEKTHLWMPQTARQVEVVLDDLAQVASRHLSRERLLMAMAAPFTDSASISIVANPVCVRRSTGAIAFRRELTICNETASLDIVVRVFHSEGSFAQRAALLGAFRAQIKSDIEAAFLSLSRSGADLSFEVRVHAEDNDSGMHGHFCALAEDAREDAFDGNYEIPEWLDLTRLQGRSQMAPCAASSMSVRV